MIVILEDGLVAHVDAEPGATETEIRQVVMDSLQRIMAGDFDEVVLD